MSNFKRLNTQTYQKTDNVTEDAIYWKRFGNPVLVKEFGPIDYVNFSPIEPHCFAVTCSVRVQVFNPITQIAVKTLSRFRESAYGATFKSDGKLICAGSEEGVVKLFDVASQSLLRLFKGHTAAVHRNYFIHSKPQILSCSDDKTVKVWDIPTETQLNSFSDHKDYVRAGAVNPIDPNIFLSGGYDQKINICDTRTNKAEASLDHGAPVEALMFLPLGGIFLSAGGTTVKVWDTANRRCLRTITQHHKTVTCLHMASENQRILSGSLDRHVKVYDLNFNVVHTMDFPNSILSLGVSKNDDTLVAGFVDGIVSVHRRKEEKKDDKSSSKKLLKFEDFNKQVDCFIPEAQLEKEAKYDKYLRKFQYTKALKCVFAKYVTSKSPEKTVVVLKELMMRNALRKSLKGMNEDFLSTFLLFTLKTLKEIRFRSVLHDAFLIFLDEFEEKLMSSMNLKRIVEQIGEILNSIENKIEQAEQHIINNNLIMANSKLGLSALKESPNLQLMPSAEAQKEFVVEIS